MFMKLTPGDNFTNILQQTFEQNLLDQKVTKPNCKHMQSLQLLSFDIAPHKMLVKLG